MKHLALIFFILVLLPSLAFGEQILWEDDSGQVVLNDDGGVSFLYGDSSESDTDEFFSVQTTPEPLYAPTPMAFTFSKTVKYGDSGDRVRAIQSRLSELGFYTAKVSGGYYKVTKAAVKAFQSHNGLNADGIAGRETQELLFSSDAVPADATPRPSPTPEPPRYTPTTKRENTTSSSAR